MVAPIRYLSRREQQQKIGILSSTEDEKVLEVVGRVGIGTTIFEPSVSLDVRGDTIVSGNLGISTLSPSANLDVNGTLNVSGVSTFNNNVGIATFNPTANLDVNGTVKVSGVSTFQSDVIINGDLQVNGTETIINSTTLEIDDKLISIAKSATNASQADGAGLDINGANARLTYAFSGDKFVFNKPVEAPEFIGDGSALTGIGISQIAGGVAGSLIGVAAGSTTYYISAVDATSGVSSNTYVKSNIVLKDGNIGIGTINPSAAADPNNTTIINTGIVTANFLYGDGSNLTNIPAPAGDWNADADNNLIAGVGAGGTYNPATGAACDNIIIGTDAGASITNGDDNIFLGIGAGKCTLNGDGNIFIGYYSGYYNTSGNQNIFLGDGAGHYNIGGEYNVFFGYDAGYYNTSGNYNFFGGYYAGYNNIDSEYNVFIGFNAGYSNTSGGCNTFLGIGAGYENTSGSDNFFGGYYAGYENTLGSKNTFLGYYSGSKNTIGSCNLFLGNEAACNTTTGCYNIAFGCRVQLPSATGNCQLAIGVGNTAWIRGDSSFNVTVGQDLTVTCNASVGGISTLGTVKISSGIVTAVSGVVTYYGDGSNLTNIEAGFSPDADNNLIAGNNAGGSYDPATGTACNNVILGTCAGFSNTDGDNNIFLGVGAGHSATNQSENIFLGTCAGFSNTDGAGNVAIGLKAAGITTTAGFDNIFIGNCAGICLRKIPQNIPANSIENILIGDATGRCLAGNENIIVGGYSVEGQIFNGCYNVFLGARVARNATGGDWNIFLGYGSGGRISCGDRNFFGGYYAGFCNAGGNDNIFMGRYAGYCNTTGSCNIFLGNKTSQNSCTGSKNIAIGCDVQFPIPNGSCQLVIGQGSNRWIVGDENFNIGIGTTNPTAKLDVNGTVALGSSVYDANGTFGNDGQILSNVTGFGVSWANTAAPAAAGSDGQLQYNNNGSFGGATDLHYDDVNNRIGIGTTNPTAKLEINIGTATTALDIQGSAGQLFSVTNNLTSGSIFSVNDVSGIPSIDVDADGTIQLAPLGASEYVGVGLTNPSSKLHVNGNIAIDQTTVVGSATSSLSTVSQTAIHSAPISIYRSVEYTIQATEGTNFHVTKILAIHDGSSTYSSEYGTVFSNSSVATFDTDISGGNLRLLATGASASQTDYVINFVGTKV